MAGGWDDPASKDRWSEPQGQVQPSSHLAMARTSRSYSPSYSLAQLWKAPQDVSHVGLLCSLKMAKKQRWARAGQQAVPRARLVCDWTDTGPRLAEEDGWGRGALAGAKIMCVCGTGHAPSHLQATNQATSSGQPSGEQPYLSPAPSAAGAQKLSTGVEAQEQAEQAKAQGQREGRREPGRAGECRVRPHR